MLSRLVIAFLSRSRHLLISWLQSPSAMILKPKKIKSLTASIVSPTFCHEVMEPDAMILVFRMLNFKPAFSLFSFTFIKRLFSSSSLSAIRVVLITEANEHTSAKMGEQAAPKALSTTETSKSQAKTVRTNFKDSGKKNERLAATK